MLALEFYHTFSPMLAFSAVFDSRNRLKANPKTNKSSSPFFLDPNDRKGATLHQSFHGGTCTYEASDLVPSIQAREYGPVYPVGVPIDPADVVAVPVSAFVLS